MIFCDYISQNDSFNAKISANELIRSVYKSNIRPNCMYISTAEAEDDDDNLTNSEFLTNLNRGGLTVPIISTVHFIQLTNCLLIAIYTAVELTSAGQALSRIDNQIAIIQGACVTLSNILLKSFVLDNSYKERQFGCLRRKEKLSFQN